MIETPLLNLYDIHIYRNIYKFIYIHIDMNVQSSAASWARAFLSKPRAAAKSWPSAVELLGHAVLKLLTNSIIITHAVYYRFLV